jgi:AcrR family transcriptional regulator
MAESGHMAESDPEELPIWARPEPAARQPRFSRDQMAAAALEIADSEGFDAVTMRRIARALGAGTMSLYRYIETRADLLALIDDALLGESLVPGDLPADWREAVAAIARRTRQTFLRHPWAVEVLQGSAAAQGAMGGPNAMRHCEQSLAALASAPFSTAAKLDLLGIVDDYVFGHVLRSAELTGRLRTVTHSPAPAAVRTFTEAQLATGSFPQLAALAADPAGAGLADQDRLDERFERGLRLLIDGFAADSHHTAEDPGLIRPGSSVDLENGG